MFTNRRKRRKNNRLYIAAISILVIAGACIYGYNVSRSPEGKNMPTPTNSNGIVNSSIQPSPTDAEVIQNNNVLADDAVVTLEYMHSKCKHTVKQIKTGDHIAGLTRQELEVMFYGMQVTEFSRNGATLMKSVDQYCPNHYILKKEVDEIRIYRPEAGKTELKLEKTITGIVIIDDSLGLEDGLLFDNLNEIEEFLEELDS